MDREGVHRVEQGVIPGLDMLTTHVNPPQGREYWITDEMMPRTRLNEIKPLFKIAEVAKIFFARSADWLRWLETQQESEGGVLELNGVRLEVKRTTAGSRVYTLADVERLARALVEHSKIDGTQYMTTINIIRWMALNYRILSEADMVPSHGEVDGQLVIPGLDEEVQEVPHHRWQTRCEPCQIENHADCEVACEVLFRSAGGQVEGDCACFLNNPEKHGVNR